MADKVSKFLSSSAIDDKVIDKFKGKKILVMGDVMVDKYIIGNVSRISPEAPVPILHMKQERRALGGAGNAVKNLLNLGAEVTLLSVVGNDLDGKWILDEMNRLSVDTSFVVIHPEKPTIQKVRFVNGMYHQLMRLDIENTKNVEDSIIGPIIEKLKQKISAFDGLLISDYAKGIVGKWVSEIIAIARRGNKPVVVDGKPINKEFFKGCSLITPNKKEASEMSGIQIKDSQSLLDMGNELVNGLQCSVMITRGKEGMSLFTGSSVEHIPALAKSNDEVTDVCGAGDTVAAVVTLALSSGLSLVEGAKLSNLAAYLVVKKKGVVAVDPSELKQGCLSGISNLLAEGIEVNQRLIGRELGNIKRFSDLLVEAYKTGNKVLVFGNGGSASDAQHLVGELVGRFKLERKGLPAIALNSETATLTAVANDYGYENVFERQVEALVQEGDIIVGITTSGNSINVIKALKKAKEMGAKTVGLTGGTGGEIKNIADLSIVVPSDNTPRIQEAHGIIIHIICELLEKELANGK